MMSLNIMFLEMHLLLFGPFHVAVSMRMLSEFLLSPLHLEGLDAAGGALPHQGFHT